MCGQYSSVVPELSEEEEGMLEFILSHWQFKLLVGCYVYALAGFLWIIIVDIKLMDESMGEITKKYPDLGIAIGAHVALITQLLAAFVARIIYLYVL